MKVLIVEDEVLARAKLLQLLMKIDESIEVVAITASVRETIQWLDSNLAPDLAFVDIQLSDEESFNIFRKREIKFPVVFTTAYDKYLLESFEYNSIDYLLKPISEEKLRRALQKMSNLRDHFRQTAQLESAIPPTLPMQSHIVAKKGIEFVAIEASKIAYFFTQHKIVFLKDFNSQKLIVDHTLSELEQKLSGKGFFRLNRKILANVKAIGRFRPDHGKILVMLEPAMNEDVHVSKESAPDFRLWIGKSIRSRF